MIRILLVVACVGLVPARAFAQFDALQIGEVIVPDAAVIDAPSKTGKTMLPAKFGVRFAIQGTEGDYYKIVAPSGDPGFIPKSSMRLVNSLKDTVASTSAVLTVEERMKQLEAKVADLQRQIQQMRRMQIENLAGAE